MMSATECITVIFFPALQNASTGLENIYIYFEAIMLFSTSDVIKQPITIVS